MDVSLRVLLAVHGHEPTEWGTRACRVISEWKEARIRVLGVVDVPWPCAAGWDAGNLACRCRLQVEFGQQAGGRQAAARRAG